MTSNRQVEMTLTSSRRWNNHPNCAKQCSSPVASPFDNKCGERSAAPACNGLPSRSAGVGDSDGSGDLGDVGSNSSGGSETAKCPSPADDTREGELDVGSNFNNRCCRNSRAGGVSPLIVFDWDDTMLTSSWIQSRELLQAASYDELPADTRQDLAHLEQSVIKCLTNARGMGTVIIITNAESGWVELSAAKFFVNLLPLLEGIPVVSARSLFEAQFPGSPLCWKSAAFAYMMHDHFVDLPRWVPKVVVSVGDSNEEKVAMRIASGQHTGMTSKAVKFVAGPDPEALASQLDIVTAHLEWIISREGDAELILSTAMINGSDWRSLPMMQQYSQQQEEQSSSSPHRASSQGSVESVFDNISNSSSSNGPSSSAAISESGIYSGSLTPYCHGAGHDKTPSSPAHSPCSSRCSSTSSPSCPSQQPSRACAAVSSTSVPIGEAQSAASSATNRRRSSSPIVIPGQQAMGVVEPEQKHRSVSGTFGGSNGGAESFSDNSGGGSSAPAPHPTWPSSVAFSTTPVGTRPAAGGSSDERRVTTGSANNGDKPSSSSPSLLFSSSPPSSTTSSVKPNSASSSSLCHPAAAMVDSSAHGRNYNQNSDNSGGRPGSGGGGGGGGREVDGVSLGGAGGAGLLPLGATIASGQYPMAEGDASVGRVETRMGIVGAARVTRTSAPMA